MKLISFSASSHARQPAALHATSTNRLNSAVKRACACVQCDTRNVLRIVVVHYNDSLSATARLINRPSSHCRHIHDEPPASKNRPVLFCAHLIGALGGVMSASLCVRACLHCRLVCRRLVVFGQKLVSATWSSHASAITAWRQTVVFAEILALRSLPKSISMR